MSSATIDTREEQQVPELTSKPFKSLAELYANVNNLNKWPDIENRQNTTDYVRSGRDINDVRKPMSTFSKNKKPKTLICHDMKGGYLNDRFIYGSTAHDSYNFYHWSAVDTFVYFSHHLVTVPPFGWIKAAHINGVKILGTIITEWDNGVKIWDDIFKSELDIKRFADAVIAVAKFYKFDGWLLNVENKIKPDDIDKLKFFVKYLTDNIHAEIIHSEIIWYDSVTRQGNLTWQNKLNDLNKCFFDLCDGIFLNYNWTDSGLAESRAKVIDENRVADVYVGVDVWGRGCPGGGGFNSEYALRKIREQNMSVAIFGPAWTHEHFGPRTFEDVENLFWAQLFPHLYIHVPLYDNKTFRTSFNRGIGLNNYRLGQHQIGNNVGEEWSGRDTPFYNLSIQSLQLSVPTPHLEFLTTEVKAAENIAAIASSTPERGEDASTTAIELFLDPKTDAKTEIKTYETKSSIVKVRGSNILFQSKPQSMELNHFRFKYDYAFDGGACLELFTKNSDLYHRLFLIQVTFEHGIQVSLVYRMDVRISEHSEPVLVIGDENELKLVRKYKTEELEFPWRRNLYLTNFYTITQIGVAALKEGTITLGEIVVEQKETGKQDFLAYY